MNENVSITHVRVFKRPMIEETDQLLHLVLLHPGKIYLWRELSDQGVTGISRNRLGLFQGADLVQIREPVQDGA